MCAINRLVVEGPWSFALRALATALRVGGTAEGARDGTDEIVAITAPQAVPLDQLNQLLAELGESPLAEQDYRPARAA
jgi:hypothetical protein